MVRMWQPLADRPATGGWLAKKCASGGSGPEPELQVEFGHLDWRSATCGILGALGSRGRLVLVGMFGRRHTIIFFRGMKQSQGQPKQR
jgi:hypothetical protein